MQPFVAGVITLSLNASAYIAEIIRGGIQAVDKGQYEACMSLGLPYSKSMQKSYLTASNSNYGSFIHQPIRYHIERYIYPFNYRHCRINANR